MREKTYSIGDAAKMAGISHRMLRNWEGLYIPPPQRLVCGERAYRRYTQSEIDLVRKIKHYQDQGFTLPAAAEKAKADFDKKGGDR